MKSYKIPKTYEHYVFGILQSAITCAVATGISTYRSAIHAEKNMLIEWLYSWGVAWLLMLPVVIIFAPFLRRGVRLLTR